jgi:hypothetical protein
VQFLAVVVGDAQALGGTGDGDAAEVMESVR